ERRRALEALAALDATLVFYESPHRTPATVGAIAALLSGRRAAMARELTKLHEEVLRGSVEDLARALEGRELKGEVVLLVGPPVAGEHHACDERAVRERVDELVATGFSTKDAVRAVAAETGLGRNAVYRIVHGGDPDS
ncbi:MAG TPA: 16S rRNA (cytidine(1402)-2'-O)-methyltransferase, partial [Coriobacteriia bacterium]|nr:16S rRNA (cytidine(1402)-2'-O)-methyltransferase [Coriobacteriia bacterium]